MFELQQLKKEILQNIDAFKANKIILFGSYAYGKPNENSDLDICIVKDKITSKIKEKREIRKLLKNINLPKDILLVDEEYFRTHSDKNWINTALYDVKHKGKVIYEKN